MTTYIASTRHAAQRYGMLGDISVIPHYHCNFEKIPNSQCRRNVGYIGSVHWYPPINGIRHDTHFVDRSSREEVASAYRDVGIAINHCNMAPVDDRYLTSPRDARPDPELHVQISSGIKLINCIGFGIPSVSPREPAYVELAPECTIFTDLDDCATAVRELQENDDLFHSFRRRCIAAAEEFHIDSILYRYKCLLRSL